MKIKTFGKNLKEILFNAVYYDYEEEEIRGLDCLRTEIVDNETIRVHLIDRSKFLIKIEEE